MTSRTDAPRERASWRSVAIPNEHGGWGLTLEPVLLGLLVAPSPAGALLGIGALLAFLARTPLRMTLVDRRRGRDLERTSLARRILTGEALLLAGCAIGAAASGDNRMWWAAAAAAPLIAVELWFDMRSRSRRLTPELAGAVGVSAVTAMIVLASGEPGRLAVALWFVLAARVLTAIPFVRDQVMRLHGRPPAPRTVLAGDAAAIAVAATAVALHGEAVVGAVAILGVIAYQRVTGRRPVARAAVLGVRQTIVGLTVVLITGLGVLAP